MAYIYGSSSYATLNGSSAKKYEVRVGYEAQAYSIEENTTPVKVIMQVRTIDSAYGTWGFTQTSTLGGVKFGAKSFSVREEDKWVTFASTTLTIEHNDDGTYSGTLKGSFTTNASDTYSLKSGSASVSMVLPTIPRITTPTLSSSEITMGDTIEITLTPALPTFKHKLKYSFGSVANLIDGLSIGGEFTEVGTSTVTFTPPTSLGAYIPKTVNGVATLYCTTFDEDGNQIGSEKGVPLTINVPSYTPTVSVDIVGENLCNGAYAEGKSYSTVTISASGNYGSVIQSYLTEVDGQTYSQDSFYTSEFSSGEKTFVVKVVDSRGLEVTNTSKSVTVYPYSNPSITSFTASRGADEVTATATLVGEVASVGGHNTSTLTITLGGVAKTVQSGETVTFTDVNPDRTLEVVASVTDVYTTISRTISIPTANVTLDFNASGKGIAIGKVSEKDALEVNIPAEFNKGITGTISRAIGDEFGNNISSSYMLKESLFDTLYPVGAVYTTSTNTSPSSILGGTWELFDKEFLPRLVSSGNFTLNTTNTTSATLTVTIGGHDIDVKLITVNKTVINDDEKKRGTIVLSAIGVTELPMAKGQLVGTSDGANAWSLWTVTADGSVSTVDCDPKNTSVAAGSTNVISWHYTVHDIETMLDSFCGKFYWRRIE